MSSESLYCLAEQHINGNITNDDIDALLYKKYADETPEEKITRIKEADIVSNRIVKLLIDQSFTFSPVTLQFIHRTLFDGIYDHAGIFRN